MDPDCGPLTDTSGSPIPLDDAVTWTGNYQSAHPNKLRSVYFTSEVFQALMDQPGAKGIRIYLANSEATTETLDTMILVSATADADLTTVGEYVLYDHGTGTPPCTVISPLNH